MRSLFTFAKTCAVATGRIGNYCLSTFTEDFTTKGIKEVIMSTKHLKKGDPLPSYSGKLRVYNMRFCPYAQRTILVLNAKLIPYEVVNVNLDNKPDWIFEKSSLGGKVPSIEIADGVTICESLVTSDFIDESYPQMPLHSKDPFRKAQDRLLVERFNVVIRVFLKALFKPWAVDDDMMKTYFETLERIQTELQQRGTKFLYGDRPGMPDYMIWPWFERFELLEILLSNKFKMEDNKFATLITWMENMKRDPAVKEYLLDINIHLKYVHGRFDGSLDYDMPLSKL